MQRLLGTVRVLQIDPEKADKPNAAETVRCVNTQVASHGKTASSSLLPYLPLL